MPCSIRSSARNRQLRQERTGASAREVMRRRLEQQRAEERFIEEDNTIEELRTQIRTLARQVQALTEANNQHAANTRAIKSYARACAK